MTPSTHIVTGGTGFVGSALIVELLRSTPHRVLGVVRPNPSASPTERLRRAVREAAQAYGAPEALLADIDARVDAVEGDVMAEGCGVSELPKGQYAQLWHSAASLRFEDRYADEIYKTNQQGTLNAVELAAKAQVEHFNYVSTAYVAGAMSGRLPEKIQAVPRTNNHYEASKAGAEAKLAEERRFKVRVMRPSIVIGHSETRQATNFTGLYGFIRKLYGFRGLMERTQPGLLQRKPITLVGEPDVPLNLIPVDQVVRDAVGLCAPSEAEQVPAVFHLTNPRAPRLRDVMDTIFGELGLPGPLWADSADELDWLDRKFNDRIDFYRSYLRGHKDFDRSCADGTLGASPGEACDMGTETLRSYVRWYIERLDAERAALPVHR
ncbi:MAG: SDR family oxidoreductase [Alphaproteobacteria bacterium]|nr:SDR family oxidoreductase [Alphaproteobacteria bacterium]MCB9791516.1 SDR family oxidoreductase [Alphaproteobacteria bacterium]